jgi:hypothetical protein
MTLGFKFILADDTKKSQEINGFKDIAFCETFDSARGKIEKYTATKNIFADRLYLSRWYSSSGSFVF